jgi:hypothetical protein
LSAWTEEKAKKYHDRGLIVKVKINYEDGDGYARMFGLKNGLDNSRFTQYKNTGIF